MHSQTNLEFDVKADFTPATGVQLKKVSKGIFEFNGNMGSFTVSGEKYTIHGGYITVPAMHTLKGKRHLIEIGLTGSSGGKKATYTVFGTNDEVSMDHKFLNSLGWEGLEQEGRLGKLGIGTIFVVPGETNPEELADGSQFYSYEGQNLSHECGETTYII